MKKQGEAGTITRQDEIFKSGPVIQKGGGGAKK